MNGLGSIATLTRAAWLGVALAVAMLGPARASEEHSHEGYYYPKVTSTEVYKSEAAVEAGATRATRLAFIVGYTAQQLSRAYAPRIAMFAKGDDAEKLIIVALDDGVMRTLFRARAVLAQMTAVARSTTHVQRSGRGRQLYLLRSREDAGVYGDHCLGRCDLRPPDHA